MKKALYIIALSTLTLGIVSVQAIGYQFTQANTSEPAAPQLKVETIEINTTDNLKLTADVYEKGNQPWILLCHQAGFSRGEYQETAPKLVAMGFNCLAIDQRSGRSANGVKNKTAAAASAKGLSTKYIDAEPDINAAIDFLLRAKTNGQPVIIVGSSYSASLVLKIGNKRQDVRAILSFSPGEYYKGESVADWVKGCDKPLFATSSKGEAKGVAALLKGVTGSNKTHFIPAKAGAHGSRALWAKQDNHQEYWKAVSAFLNQLK